MSETYICIYAKECESMDCLHRVEHKEDYDCITIGCDREVFREDSKCIRIIGEWDK